jgi:hypothetical protein
MASSDNIVLIVAMVTMGYNEYRTFVIALIYLPPHALLYGRLPES